MSRRRINKMNQILLDQDWDQKKAVVSTAV
jgi:hypothetical protein